MLKELVTTFIHVIPFLLIVVLDSVRFSSLSTSFEICISQSQFICYQIQFR